MEKLTPNSSIIGGAVNRLRDTLWDGIQTVEAGDPHGTSPGFLPESRLGHFYGGINYFSCRYVFAFALLGL